MAIVYPSATQQTGAARASTEHGLACLVTRLMREDLAHREQLTQALWNHEQRLLRLLFLVADWLTEALRSDHSLYGTVIFRRPGAPRPVRLITLETALRNAVRQLGWLEADPTCPTGLRLTPAGEQAALDSLTDWSRRLSRSEAEVLASLRKHIGRWQQLPMASLDREVLNLAGRRVQRYGPQASLIFQGDQFSPARWLGRWRPALDEDGSVVA